MTGATIHKFPFETTDSFELDIPIGAEFLDIQVQKGIPCMWLKVRQPNAATRKVQFRVYGTGHPISSPDELDYLGTYQTMGGTLIFHLFCQHLAFWQAGKR